MPDDVVGVNDRGGRHGSLAERPKLKPLWAFTNYGDFPINRIVELASSVFG